MPRCLHVLVQSGLVEGPEVALVAAAALPGEFLAVLEAKIVNFKNIFTEQFAISKFGALSINSIQSPQNFPRSIEFEFIPQVPHTSGRQPL